MVIPALVAVLVHCGMWRYAQHVENICWYHSLGLFGVLVGISVVKLLGGGGDCSVTGCGRSASLLSLCAALVAGLFAFGGFALAVPSMERFSWSPCSVVFACVVGPVLEELFWRGRMFDVQDFSGRVVRLFVTTVGFAAYHAVGDGAADYLLLYVWYGACFGVVRFVTGQLFMAVIAHVTASGAILACTYAW